MIATAITIATFFVSSSLFPTAHFVRVITVMLLSAALPGYAWTLVIFRHKDATLFEQLMFGIVLSIVLTAVIAYGMSFSLRIGLRTHALLGGLAIVTFIGAGIAYLQQRRIH